MSADNWAISRCPLCNLHGYRPNGLVCDHVDHAPAYARGMAAVRAALQKSPGECDPIMRLPEDTGSNQVG